ncbi:MAG: SRPBCC family protein [Acidobacteriota bacterium]
MSALPTPIARPIRKVVRRFARPVNLGPAERWLSAVAGGGLVLFGLTRRRRIPGVALAMTGAGLAWRGITGHCDVYGLLGVDRAPDRAVRVEESVTVHRPAAELYRFWRNLENLPRVFEHLISVGETDAKHSHWVATAPADVPVEWDAQIVADREGEVIAWRTSEDSEISHRGSVRFDPATGGRGTLVTVSLEYAPPAGRAGVAIAKLLGEDPKAQIHEDLRRFKQVAEAGEVPTTDGQPSGRESREDERRAS